MANNAPSQDHHFKRMGVEKTEKELEDALHRYRQSKQDFDDKRERIFSECVRSASTAAACLLRVMK